MCSGFSAKRRRIRGSVGVYCGRARAKTEILAKDEICVETCAVDCIHPKKDDPGFAEAPHLFVDPEACIDCGASIPVCPTNSVFALDDLPAELAQFAEKNAAYYSS